MLLNMVVVLATVIFSAVFPQVIESSREIIANVLVVMVGMAFFQLFDKLQGLLRRGK